jgi:PAS domain S-box-containing protein
MRDTSERTRAESRIHHLLATLTKTKDEWEKTFDSVTEQILLVDRDLNLIRCNKSFADSMRSSVQELIGSKCNEFMLCDAEWLSGIEGKEQPKRVEVKTYDGQWLYVSTLPVYDKNIFLYTIITATDITEMKKTQQNLMESKQELNERIGELENFYDMAVNRELKMVKLKEQVEKLSANNGNDDNGSKKAQPQEVPNSAYIFNNKNMGNSK